MTPEETIEKMSQDPGWYKVIDFVDDFAYYQVKEEKYRMLRGSFWWWNSSFTVEAKRIEKIEDEEFLKWANDEEPDSDMIFGDDLIGNKN